MNMQQVAQPRSSSSSSSSSNGYGRRKVEKDAATRSDNKSQGGKTNYSRTNFGKRGLESPSRDRLMYLTTCLIGHQVEVQVLDGSIFSGIFHATNAEDFGIVLKMAHLLKDGSRGQKSILDFPSKPPAKTFIIPAKDLVQVIAKGVPVTRDGLTNELQHEKQQEIMTDSYISQSRHVDAGRELEPWMPDENDPSCAGLDDIFNNPWNRGWDQFEANAALFGVTSTFNEELYTTKLERGPQTRELEREAMRIAREIEGEETRDLHLAEERGMQLDGDLEVDEETRFSSVYRGIVDDSGYDEIENILLDSRNDETFGGVSSSVIGKPLTDTSIRKTSDGTQTSSRFLSMGDVQSSLTALVRDSYHSGSINHGPQLPTEQLHKQSSLIDANSLLRLKKESSDKVALSPNATAFDPSLRSSKGQEKANSSNELPGEPIPSKIQVSATNLGRPGSSASSSSDCGGAVSTSATRGFSPSPSVSSLSSEKSSLNPNAKEFKFNPNAKSFVPTQASLRPSSPALDSPFYYPANVAPVSQMHGMPVGIGVSMEFLLQL
ncbi:hypothetical protein MIMGU_mgv1a020926mg [Erythranthe guttata]|uniref:LsmAD domain-containing protein n=1 Tax=Erythranthe guttata TaxID=4155 RepID=A0A022S1W7_ERYGU|nr:hypothetical protein MIMGU_mgv1a020926mg [Erythranthe guttata]